MRIKSSTDGKYVGEELNKPKIGDVVELGDFDLEVQFVHEMEDGSLMVGFPNYQLILEA